jgi:hypothetical protein
MIPVSALPHTVVAIPGDIYDAPQGVIGIGFDDGPLPVSHSCSFYVSFMEF